MANGRRKKHHAHELGDPYSEAWDAHTSWNGKSEKPTNPYRPVVPHRPVNAELGTPAWFVEQERLKTRMWEITQWDLGWDDWEIDAEKGDLAAVTKADFKYLGVRRPPPREPEDD